MGPSLLCEVGAFHLLDIEPSFQVKEMLLLLFCQRLAPHLPFDAPTFKGAYVRKTLLSPYDLATFDMLEAEVDFPVVRVVDNFQQGHHVGMSDFFEDGDFPLGLLERRHVLGDPAEPTFSGEAGDNFDGDVLADIEVTGQLHLTMNTAANFLDNLVMIDDLAASGEVSIDIGDMCLSNSVIL